jgi:transglutaminase-like putative cysteine protease
MVLETRGRSVDQVSRLRAFDIAGIIAVLLFAVVTVNELGVLRWSQQEMAVEVSAEDLDDGFHEGVAWHGYYMRGAKVGFSRLEQRREAGGFRILSYSLFDLQVMRTSRRLELELEAMLDQELALRSFEVSLDSDFTKLEASGEVLTDRIDVVIRTGGIEEQTSLPIERPPSFAFNLRPALMRQSPQQGQRIEYDYFDPATLTTRKMTIEYLGLDRVNVMGEDVEAHHLRQEVSGQILDAWVNDLGDVLREELAIGITAVRETEADATYGLGRGAAFETADLIAAAAIPALEVADDLPDRERASYRLSQVDLQGFDLDGGRQRFVPGAEPEQGVLTVERESAQGGLQITELAGIGSELGEYLTAEPLLQVDDPDIRATAMTLVEQQQTVRDAAREIVYWVHDSIEKTNVIGIPSAIEVYRNRRGDCNEHTILSVALLRAAGIPARIVIGIAYMDGSFYYHAWPEYWDGTWVTADPTWGQLPADIGHLRFVTGGLGRQIDILRLIGTLQVSGVPDPNSTSDRGAQ